MENIDRQGLITLLTTSSKTRLSELLPTWLTTQAQEQLAPLLASCLIELCQPRLALPASLARLGTLVENGMEYFLSHISFDRLRKAVLDQADLPAGCPAPRRLFHLALHFPTLHKLGQIVARRRDLSEEIRPWLIRLENGPFAAGTVDFPSLLRDLQDCGLDRAVSMEETILAEASVAMVIPYLDPDTDEGCPAVCKILKPGIEEKLQEELAVLGKAASHFESFAELFGLGQMKTGSLFAELRDDLLRETNLLAEQDNLRVAALLYAQMERVKVPRLQALCTDRLTTMEYSSGCKASEVPLPAAAKLTLAERLFEALICIPLFYQGEYALFHGDPHGGNILVEEDGRDGTIVLIDWTLAAHLNKTSRARIMELLLGVLTEDTVRLSKTISTMTRDTVLPASMERLEPIIQTFFTSQAKKEDPLATAFHLLEELSMAGTLFPSELIVLRKAFFTLEGVLTDLAPDFQAGIFMEKHLRNMVLAELPTRLVNCCNPTDDIALGYRSLLSNLDVQQLSWHQALEIWRGIFEQSSDLLTTQMAYNQKLHAELISLSLLSLPKIDYRHCLQLPAKFPLRFPMDT